MFYVIRTIAADAIHTYIMLMADPAIFKYISVKCTRVYSFIRDFFERKTELSFLSLQCLTLAPLSPWPTPSPPPPPGSAVRTAYTPSGARVHCQLCNVFLRSNGMRRSTLYQLTYANGILRNNLPVTKYSRNPIEAINVTVQSTYTYRAALERRLQPE